MKLHKGGVILDTEKMQFKPEPNEVVIPLDKMIQLIDGVEAIFKVFETIHKNFTDAGLTSLQATELIKAFLAAAQSNNGGEGEQK